MNLDGLEQLAKTAKEVQQDSAIPYINMVKWRMEIHPDTVLKLIERLKEAESCLEYVIERAHVFEVHDWHTNYKIINGGHVQCPIIRARAYLNRHRGDER